jgi:peptidoglycan hydrolase CwlO-like protein
MPLVRRSGSRALVAGVLVVLCTVAGGALAPFASAQATSNGTSDLRSQADALSSKYFATLERVQSLGDDITQNEQRVDELLVRAKQARDAARARALIAYQSSGTQLSTLVDATDTLDSARRARLIDRVNAHDQHVFETLRAATVKLHKQQRELRASQQAQSDALDELKAQGAAIDAKLAQAEAQDQAQAAAATRATAAAAAAADPTTTSTTAGAPGAAPAASAPSTTTATVPAPPAPTPPPDYSGTPGVSSHHDDPFLACVRQRESGGNYSAVNPAGPYLGAYQFLQSTWNVTAAHAGRSDLVGVPANVASAYDQDEMAWALYQWQGPGPWGGGC